MNRLTKTDFKKFLVLLGKRINYLRTQQNKSIKEISDKTGIRTDYLKKIEKGEAVGVKIVSHLIKIAEELNITMYNLLDL